MKKMGEEIGKVVKVEQGQMTVQLAKGQHCNVCAAKSLCTFEGPEAAYRFIELPYENGFQEGSQVKLEYRESTRITAAFIIFMLPIIFMLVGYALADRYLDFVNRGLVGAFAGFVLSGGLLYLLNRVLAKSRFFLPRVIQNNSSQQSSFQQKGAHHGF
ncbi:MAG: hypothetical protein Kow0042_01680 [Calditrichia bacterium]